MTIDGRRYRGVCEFAPGRFRAVLVADRVKHCLGVYPTAILAALAYDRAALDLLGDAALPILNFPKESTDMPRNPDHMQLMNVPDDGLGDGQREWLVDHLRRHECIRDFLAEIHFRNAFGRGLGSASLENYRPGGKYARRHETNQGADPAMNASQARIKIMTSTIKAKCLAAMAQTNPGTPTGVGTRDESGCRRVRAGEMRAAMRNGMSH